MPGPGSPCDWCGQPIPETDPETGKRKRSDARTCTQPCRQAKHRFRVGPAPAAAGRAMRFAYADPPYPGLSRRYYLEHDAYGGEVNHAELVSILTLDYPDGWALSTSAAALGDVLALCPAGARVACWIHGPRHHAKSRRELNAWEPVIVWGGRQELQAVAQDLCDVLLWGGRQHTHPGALVGMKPAPFAEWLFRMLGARQGDQLDDLFPGSGAVSRAWRLFQSGGSPGGLPSRLQDAQRELEQRLTPGTEDGEQDQNEDQQDDGAPEGHAPILPASEAGTLALFPAA